jgi:NIPSNAP
MEYQIRNYKVKPGMVDQVIEEWRSNIVPIRTKKGFKIIGAWASEKENRFTWVMSYDGPEGFDAADKAYYESPERKSVKQDPRRLLAEVDLVVMKAVSPR